MPIMNALLLAAIPFDMLVPHEAQALKNHGQTLEKLASRGGLSASEALAVLEDRTWRRLASTQEGEIALINKVREWRVAATQGEPITDSRCEYLYWPTGRCDKCGNVHNGR